MIIRSSEGVFEGSIEDVCIWQATTQGFPAFVYDGDICATLDHIDFSNLQEAMGQVCHRLWVEEEAAERYEIDMETEERNQDEASSG